MANGSSANTKLPKTQLKRIGQSGGFLGRPIWPLFKTGLSLIGNVLRPLTKIVLIPLELTAVALAMGAAIQKKMFWSITTTLVISNEEMNDIIKIIKLLEESGLLIKGVVKKLKYWVLVY